MEFLTGALPRITYIDVRERLTAELVNQIISQVMARSNLGQKNFTLIVRNKLRLDDATIERLADLRQIVEQNGVMLVLVQPSPQFERNREIYYRTGLKAFQEQRDADLYHSEQDQREVYKQPTSS